MDNDDRISIIESISELGYVYPAAKWYFSDHQYDYNAADELDGTFKGFLS